MWAIDVFCSDCAEEEELVVEELDDADAEVCPCGYSYVVVAVAEWSGAGR